MLSHMRGSRSVFRLAVAPVGTGTPAGSVANYRKQESSVSQVIDFLTPNFRLWPQKGQFATEPLNLLKAFGHPEEVIIGRQEYDRLFVIVPKPTGPPLVFVLRFSGG